MMKFIENANLPQRKVSLVVSGELPLFLKEFLTSRNIDVLTCENNYYIDTAVKSHADMSVVHVGGNLVVVDSVQKTLIETLSSYGFSVFASAKKVAGEYPEDVKLNVALFGDKAIGKFAYTDQNLLEHIDNFQKYYVKQGYSKCSVLPINKNAIITDDESIYKTLKNDVDALLISKGDIVLEGHDYGFIGGASCKISNDEILFFGDLYKHRDADKILMFLNKYNHRAISFKDELLYDFGGLITLCEI